MKECWLGEGETHALESRKSCVTEMVKKSVRKKTPHSQHMKEAALSSGRDIYISESP